MIHCFILIVNRVLSIFVGLVGYITKFLGFLWGQFGFGKIPASDGVVVPQVAALTEVVGVNVPEPEA